MQRTEKEPTGIMFFLLLLFFFFNRNSPAHWKLHFHSHRSQTFGKSRKIFATSSTLFLFSMGFLEAKKMTSATAKPVKVFDGLLV